MRNSQSGSALAIGLVLLTAITLISITSLQRSGLQTKIVSNFQHREQLFTAANSDQEHWFQEFRNSLSGDSLLSEPLLAYTQDEAGNLNYSNVPLRDRTTNRNRQEYLHINSISDVVYSPTKEGGVALSSGHEANNRIKFRFILESTASQNIGNKQNIQQSGLEFPGLNSAQSRTN